MKTKPHKKRKQRKTVGYWSFNRGMGEPTTEDRLEIEARTKELLEKRLEKPVRILDVPIGRASTGIYRTQGSGVRRAGFSVDRD